MAEQTLDREIMLGLSDLLKAYVAEARLLVMTLAEIGTEGFVPALWQPLVIQSSHATSRIKGLIAREFLYTENPAEYDMMRATGRQLQQDLRIIVEDRLDQSRLLTEVLQKTIESGNKSMTKASLIMLDEMRESFYTTSAMFAAILEKKGF